MSSLLLNTVYPGIIPISVFNVSSNLDADVDFKTDFIQDADGIAGA